MLVSRVLGSCVVIYAFSILIELFRTRRISKFLLQLLALLVVIVLALLVSATGTGIVSFGNGASPVGVVVVMFLSPLFGIVARYIFYLKRPFSWLDFLKPLCISPIILLPLIGSLQGIKNLEAMQVVSFALLAFQNGFFWEVVLERANPQH